MRNKLYLALTAVAAGLALTSCSKMGALSSDNFSVTPNPLETVGDQVPATINGRFPEKYMKKKTKNKIIVLTLLLIVYLFGIYTQPDTKTENKEKFSTKERKTEKL